MGDLADDIRDRMMDGGWFGRPRTYGPPLQCLLCGSRQVYWQRVRGEYRIFNVDTIDEHNCRGPADPSEFEVLPAAG